MIRKLCALALFVAPILSAQEAPPRPLEFTGDLGFVSAAGNTDLTTLNVGEKIKYTLPRITLNQFFALVYGETDGQTTTSLWRTGVRGDVPLSGRLAAYGLVGFDRNRFAGIERRFEEGAGLGVKVIASERNKLDLEAGIDVTQQRSTLDENNNFTAARAAGIFQHNFRPTAYFLQTIEVLPNLEISEDLRINTETALVAPLSKRFAVKLSYVIRYDKLPEPGFKKTDRLFTSGLQVTL